MKRLFTLAVLALVFKLFFGGNLAYSQATFKIPFKFEAEGKSYPPAITGSHSNRREKSLFERKQEAKKSRSHSSRS